MTADFFQEISKVSVGGGSLSVYALSFVCGEYHGLLDENAVFHVYGKDRKGQEFELKGQALNTLLYEMIAALLATPPSIMDFVLYHYRSYIIESARRVVGAAQNTYPSFA